MWQMIVKNIWTIVITTLVTVMFMADIVLQIKKYKNNRRSCCEGCAGCRFTDCKTQKNL